MCRPFSYYASPQLCRERDGIAADGGGDAAPVPLGDAPCDGQADAEAVPAGAGGVGPIEPVKQPGGVDVSGVLAPVGHGERHAPAQHGPDAAYS